MKKLFLGLIALSTLFALNSCDKVNDTNYTVTFDSQGGTSVEKITVAEGSLISKPTDPTKQESTFGGWYREAAATTAWNFSSDKVTSNITLYAKWISGDAYTVTFNTNGGVPVPEPQVVEKGDMATRPATNPTKELNTFDDWYTNGDFTAKYNFNSAVNADITIHAKWNPTMDRQELIDSLEELVEEASALVENDYQLSGWVNMQEKLRLAKDLLDDIDNADDSEILAAHTALKLAIENLILGETTAAIAWIDIYPGEIDHKIYVVTGRYFGFITYFMSSKGDELDYVAVFEYPGLEDWAEEGRVEASNRSLIFEALDLNSGLQKQITVSAQRSSFSQTYIFETISYTELVDLFKATIDGLDPENIDYDDLEEIRKASNLYWSYNLNSDSELGDYSQTIEDLENAFWALPIRMKYTVDGTSAQWVMIDDNDYTTDLEFEAQGAFPLGNWTVTMWEYVSDYNAYVQYRYIFKSGGVLAGESRTSINRDGSNPTAWEEEVTGTYEVDPNGNSTQGTFYISLSFDDTESMGAKKFSRR